jgi:Fe-S-cluster-containing dehydrogenase component
MADYSNYGLLFDYKYCSNCHTCEVACKNHLKQTAEQFEKTPGIVVLEKGPYQLEEGNTDAWDWDYIPVPTKLCDLCVDRLEAGKRPWCEKHCLAACIEYGPLDKLAERALKIGHKVSIVKP